VRAASADIRQLMEEKEKLLEISNMLRSDLNKVNSLAVGPSARNVARHASWRCSARTLRSEQRPPAVLFGTGRRATSAHAAGSAAGRGVA
jgi:hypothetical protein